MVAPPDNDVLWARALRHSHQGSPALLGVSLGRAPGRDPRGGRTARRGQDHTAALPVRAARAGPGRGVVQQRARAHPARRPPATGCAATASAGSAAAPQLLPELTAWENAALPLLMRGAGHRAARSTRAGVAGPARHRRPSPASAPPQLLQAERQRVAVARALVAKPEVVFADEPTAPLHRADRAQVLRTLTSAARSHGITVVLATGDPEVTGVRRPDHHPGRRPPEHRDAGPGTRRRQPVPRLRMSARKQPRRRLRPAGRCPRVLSLRILRGARTTALLRWALVTAASAATGLLLLSALGYALGHPEPHHRRRGTAGVVRGAGRGDRAARGGGARAEPTGWPRTGLSAVGLGPIRVALLAAATTAVACGLGSGVALLVFLHLRGDLAGVPFDGGGVRRPRRRRAAATRGRDHLLSLVPMAAAAIGAAALWPARGDRRTAEAADRTGHSGHSGRRPQPPAGLPWGVALTAVGLAVEVSAPGGTPLPLPGGLGSVTPAAVGGWIVTTVGMVLAGPGVVHACGRLLAAYRPGALRLLAGRALQEEARRIGRPLGVVCATATAAFAAYDLHHGQRPPLRPADLHGRRPHRRLRPRHRRHRRLGGQTRPRTLHRRPPPTRRLPRPLARRRRPARGGTPGGAPPADSSDRDLGHDAGAVRRAGGPGRGAGNCAPRRHRREAREPTRGGPPRARSASGSSGRTTASSGGEGDADPLTRRPARSATRIPPRAGGPARGGG